MKRGIAAEDENKESNFFTNIKKLDELNGGHNNDIAAARTNNNTALDPMDDLTEFNNTKNGKIYS